MTTTDDLGYHDLHATLATRFGITFARFNNGGGCHIWETRLETGHWLWVSDYDPWIIPRACRQAAEDNGHPVGWQINIYAHQPDTDSADTRTCLAGVHHATATAEQLPDLIEQTLRALPGREHHHYSADGTHTVRHGAQHY